jgi:nucleoside-triphosphatase
MKILLTGSPGVGKTTVIKKIAQALGNRAGGFFTEEIRERGRRMGFAIEALSGQKGILAHKGTRSKFRVGRYGVNLSGIEEIGVASVREAVAQKGVLVIDEIGKMELYSQEFRKALLDAFDADTHLVATIMFKDTDFSRALKARPDVKIVEITPKNRDGLPKEVISWLRETDQAIKSNDNFT